MHNINEHLFCLFIPFRELRNLVEPVLSRYRWNRRKPCSSLRSSAKAQQTNSNDKNSFSAKTHQAQNDDQDLQGSETSFSTDDASQEADELESKIGASDLYRWIVPEFEILNLVPAKSPYMMSRPVAKSRQRFDQKQMKPKKNPSKSRRLKPKKKSKRRNNRRRGSFEGGRGRSEWRPVGNITVESATVNTILYIGADQVPSYISLDGPEFAPYSRPTLYMTNSGKHRFRVVTNIAPPFVIESTKLDNNTCLTGDFCLKVSVNCTFFVFYKWNRK